MKTVLERLWKTLYQNEGISALVEVSADILGNPVYVIDASSCVIAASSQMRIADTYMKPFLAAGKLPDSELSMMKQWMLKELHNANAPYVALQRQHKKNHRFILAPLRLKGEMVAFLASMELNRAFTESDIHLAQQIAEAITIEFQKSRTFQDNRGTELGYQLLQAITKKAKFTHFTGWKPQKYSHLIFLGRKSWLFEDEPQNIILFALRPILFHSIVAKIDTGIVMLISQNKPFTPASKEYQTLADFCSIHNLCAGYSRRITDFSACPTYFKEAKDTLMLLLQKNERPGVVTSFEDRTIDHILIAACSAFPPESLYSSGLAALQTYDSENGTDYVYTLKVLLALSQNTSAVCQCLAIHKNTLYYRISKIKEISGYNLTDSFELMRLQLSFRLLDLGLLNG